MRFIVFVAGVAMALSFAVTWFEAPFAGQDLSPLSVFGEQLQTYISDGPWQIWVFFGGFVLAALAAAVALLGRASAILALLAGLSPVVLGVHFYLRADELRGQLPLPVQVDFSDLGAAWDVLNGFVAQGLYMYAGGALVLLLAGVALSSGQR